MLKSPVGQIPGVYTGPSAINSPMPAPKTLAPSTPYTGPAAPVAPFTPTPTSPKPNISGPGMGYNGPAATTGGPQYGGSPLQTITSTGQQPQKAPPTSVYGGPAAIASRPRPKHAGNAPLAGLRALTQNF